jgi:hypothetical protein
MPIRINLLAEAQASDEARRRDPVKRAIWICGILIGLTLAWSGQLYLKLKKTQRELQSEEARWKQNEAGIKSISEAQKQMLEAQRKLDSLTTLSTNRFLWAPVLNGLQKAIVPVANEIQLEQVRGTQSYEIVSSTPASKDGKGGKRGATIERVALMLRARDFGNPNEANYNKFKSALNSEAYLKMLLPKNEGVRLSGSLAGPSSDALDPNKLFYQFALECRFVEIRHDE